MEELARHSGPAEDLARASRAEAAAQLSGLRRLPLQNLAPLPPATIPRGGELKLYDPDLVWNRPKQKPCEKNGCNAMMTAMSKMKRDWRHGLSTG